MKKQGEIVFTKYGPYTIVDVPLYTEDGTFIETPRVYSLCRCGASNSKPFCDGTHGKINFVGEREKNKLGKTKIYSGENISIYDNRYICCHDGSCSLENVFLPNDTPWINPDGNPDIEKIIEIIKLCPSGALTYEINKEHITAWFDEEKIIFTKEGPLHIQGPIEIKDDQSSDEILISKDHYSLCTCGKSKKKPFCDGSHDD